MHYNHHFAFACSNDFQFICFWLSQYHNFPRGCFFPRLQGESSRIPATVSSFAKENPRRKMENGSASFRHTIDLWTSDVCVTYLVSMNIYPTLPSKVSRIEKILVIVPVLNFAKILLD